MILKIGCDLFFSFALVLALFCSVLFPKYQSQIRSEKRAADKLREARKSMELEQEVMAFKKAAKELFQSASPLLVRMAHQVVEVKKAKNHVCGDLHHPEYMMQPRDNRDQLTLIQSTTGNRLVCESYEKLSREKKLRSGDVRYLPTRTKNVGESR